LELALLKLDMSKVSSRACLGSIHNMEVFGELLFCHVTVAVDALLVCGFFVGVVFNDFS